VPTLALPVLIAFAIVMRILRERGRSAQAKNPENYAKGERLRPLLMTLLDPAVGIIFVGPVLWNLMSRSALHFVAAIIGALLAIPIAYARAKVMYVRAEPALKMIVLRRSAAEYGLLAILVILRSGENSIGAIHSGVATLALTALIALGVVETVARAYFIAQKYQRETAIVTDQGQ